MDPSSTPADPLEPAIPNEEGAQPDAPTDPAPQPKTAVKKFRFAAEILFFVLLLAGGTVVFMLTMPKDQAIAKNKKPTDGAPPMEAMAAMGKGNSGDRFGRMDKNQDGKITEEEAGKLWRFMRLADKNKDNAITPDEMTGMPARPKGRGMFGGMIVMPKQRTTWTARAIRRARVLQIDDDAELVGFVLGDIKRAYLLKAFQGKEAYVVHDKIGDVSLTIAYCEKTKQARAFRYHPDVTDANFVASGVIAAGLLGSARGQSYFLTMAALAKRHHRTPKLISFGGWDSKSKKGGMLLEFDGRKYSQETGRAADATDRLLPYPEAPLTATTWKEWKKEHPDSFVYYGHQGETDNIVQTAFVRPVSETNYFMIMFRCLPFLPAALVFMWLLVKWVVFLLNRQPAVKTA